ncbi:MAG TPA: Gfo/Idh/MocA family oxidoreductase [Gemmatimonadales bacterium]
MSRDITRRDFVADGARLALGAMIAPPMIVPRHVLGGPGYRAPSDTLNVAIVGAGGMGMSNMSKLLDENVVALCDVDFPYVERSLAGWLRPRQDGTVNPVAPKLEAAYRKAAKHADFRRMLERQKDIDAVLVATPDHLHATIAAAAMRLGKHVYVQKPLTWSVHESRTLARLAKETGVTTQMGNQGHSMEGTRRIVELIASGIIGPVREVHVYTDRPQRYWAQGIPRPVAATATAATQAQGTSNGSSGAVPPRWNMRTVDRAVLAAMEADAQQPPPGLDWDLFLGPAREIPYHPAYHPFSWRGWVDFGVSAIGDMGAHLMDQPYWALGLTYPTSITASSTPWGGSAEDPGTYPLAMTAEFEFAARGAQPPVRMYWYDGGLMPPRPPFLPDELPIPGGDGGGGIFVGERGILTYETYGNNPQLFPASLAAEAERVPKTFQRVEESHEADWVLACRGQREASCPFSYAAPLTELMLLGVVALRTGQGRKLLYDGDRMAVTNIPEANQWLTREYRAGWSL